MDRPGACIILDKKYKIANSSCHFGSYGSIYRPVRHQKNSIWTSETSVHIIFFWRRTGPYTAIWPSMSWTICYIYIERILYGSFHITFRINPRHQYHPESFSHIILCWSYTCTLTWENLVLYYEPLVTWSI